MRTVNEIASVLSTALLSVMVGSPDVFQHTPTEVIRAFPSLVIFPPE